MRVEHNGKSGAVVAQGWSIDREIGFSASFSFRYKSSCDCEGDLQHLYGTGIMIAAGGMGHSTDATASDIVFSPLVAMRNNSAKQLAISPVLSFDTAEGVENVTLPGLTLGSQETTVVNLRKYQEEGLFPLSVEMGAIDLQYKGEHSALVAEAASVDQNGSFVSPVPLACNGNPDQHMTFWRTDGDWHSSITVENISSQASDLQVTVSYPGGIYVFEKNVASHKTIMVSINELQQSQEPDSAGRRIPLDATFGGVNIWDRNVNKGLVINAMLINPVTKTCQSCSNDGYAYTAYPNRRLQRLL